MHAQSLRITVPACFLVVLLVLALPQAKSHKTNYQRYIPTWDSLDARPLPSWYDEAKFGIFLTWGIYSVPSFGSEWFWNYLNKGIPKYVNFMKQNYPPSFTYADFAAQFTAEFYNPDEWADIFQASGAKYLVLTTKHHEGFCNWPTNVSFNWNAMACGPKRDLVGDLAASIRKKTDIRLGLYHSLFEWFNPLYLEDKANNFSTRVFSKSKTIPELHELIEQYQPDVVWSDGPAGPVDYWGSLDFLAWLYNDSPVKDTVVVNDRWCTDCACHHGGYYTCDDRYNPGVLQKHKWENCMTIDKFSWGYRREAVLSDFLTMDDLVKILAETVSCGGNLLMNVGPTHDGRIVPIFEERLRGMGAWLKVNGEAIYSSVPWAHQNDTVTKNVWYTAKKSSSGYDVYAIVLNWPAQNLLFLGAPNPGADTRVTLVGYSGADMKWQKGSQGGIQITIPPISAVDMPCDWAWVFKFEKLTYYK